MYHRVNDQPVHKESYVQLGSGSTPVSFTKGELIAFYALMVAVLALVGYLVRKEMGLMVGIVIGVSLSVILWFAWGKNHTK